MGVKRSKRGDDVFGLSDDVIKWLESVTSFLANLNAEHGSVSEMAEQPEWDVARNAYILSLLKGLKKEIAQLTTEFKSHVESQTRRR